MKKVMCNVMVILLCLSLLLNVGCSSVKTDNDKGEEQNIEQTQNNANTGDKYEPEKGKKYVLEWAKTNTHPIDENPIIVKNIEDKLDVKINVWSFDPKTQYEQLGLKIASGEVPDIFTVTSFSNYAKFVNEEVVLELNEDAIKKYAPNMYKIYQEENPNAFKYYRVDGKLYGIPGYRDHYLYNRPPVVWRGDWLKQVGINKTPETIEEFEDALYKFVKEDPNKSGKNDTYGLSTSSIELIYGAFGQPRNIWFEKEGKLAYSTVQPEAKDTLALLAKWYKDGVIDPEYITGENTGGYWGITHAFVNGKIGLTSHGAYYHWIVPMYEGHPGLFNYVEFEKVNPDAAKEIIFGLPPKGTNGKMGATQEAPIAGNGTCVGITVNKDPGKLGKILQIFDYVYSSEENFKSSVMGIKGTHWDYDKTNSPQFINDFDIGKAASQGGNTLFICSEPIKFMNPTTKAFGDKYRFSEGGVSTKLLTNLASSAQYQEELNTLLDGAITAIITGEKPVDYFDEVIEKWHSSGGDVLTKEANEWYQSVK